MKNKIDFAALIVSILALSISGWTFKRSEDLQKETATYTIWQNYLQFAVNNSGLANGYRPKNDTTHKYEWFVAKLLSDAEEVYHLQVKDTSWRNTIKEAIDPHLTYLNSTDFKAQRKVYDPEFIKILDEATNKH